MARISIANFQDIKATADPIPAGTYPCIIAKGEVKSSKEKNEPYVAWEFTVVAGAHMGRKLFHNTYVSEKAAWTTKMITEAAGVTGDKTGFITEECIGKKVSVSVAIGKYNELPVNIVARVTKLQP